MSLIAPYGGTLCDLVVDPSRAGELKAESTELASWDLTPRQVCDIELLLNGSFSPLRGYMTEADWKSVCENMRLADGTLWPLPITLDVSEEFAEKAAPGARVALRDPEGVVLAILTVSDRWTPDREWEAETVFGSKDVRHPGAQAMVNANPVYLGGTLEGLELPHHYDFKQLRNTPAELREHFEKRGWSKVVAFQTRNPLHRAHYELTRRAAEETGAGLLIHPVVGLTKPGDVDHYTRVRCYEALLPRYPEGTVELSLLNLAMRMGGPREAILHAIIRRNHGVTHFIVGRDHAGPGKDSQGNDFYGPYDAQELVIKCQEELGVEMVPFKLMVYVPGKDEYYPVDEVPEGEETANISGTEQRELLAAGAEIPEWFSFPEVVEELRKTSPPRSEQGVTVFFTGLSGSGKSTIANILLAKLLEQGGRQITLLDGDLVRKHLSKGLGFSKEDRDTNILRIGWVAAEVTRHGGIAVCAPIAPYEATRSEVRRMVEEGGGFILVHVATPLEECEKRDRKGLYAQARAGKIKGFTGIDDPYEEPTDAQIVLTTVDETAEQSADRVLDYLRSEGYLA
ncbi:MAG: bifunctional sulfate adenylyltransferase/adenylylsulfate kinase [Actinomycetota bacterium]